MEPRLSIARALLAGLVAGLLLSLARAPLGGELLLLPAVTPERAMAFRALGLVAVALGVGASARRFGSRTRAIALACGAALGFGLHGLVALHALELRGWLGLAVAALAAVLAMSALAAGRLPEEAPRGPGVVERLGLALCGAGVAMSLEATARPLRLMGGQLPGDDSAFGFALLVAVAFGAAAFGPLLAPAARRAPLLPLAAAVAAGACLYALGMLAQLSDPEALQRFLRGGPWGLDTSLHGTLAYDLLLGARVWLVPGFLLGTALACAAHRGQLASLLAGGAAGLLAFPWLAGQVTAAYDQAMNALRPASFADVAQVPAARAAWGAAVAAAGALVAALATRGTTLAARGGAAVACAALALAALLGPRPEALPLSPWERFPTRATFVRDTPVGVLTVEATLDLGYVATLDRRWLTPSPGEEEHDAQRMRLSWSLVPAPSHGRLLLVGLLTPGRAAVLRELGASEIDRAGAWHPWAAELEARLFGDQPLPPGEVLAPDAARALLAKGHHALALAPPVGGPAPALPHGERRVPWVAWIDLAAWAAHRELPERVLLAGDGLQRLSLGAAPALAAGFATGAPIAHPIPLEWLRVRTLERELASRAALLRRLARAAEPGPDADLTAGLALLLGAQRRSSPFESEAQQVEIDEEGLARLSAAARAREPDLFLRALWEDLARLLADRREPLALAEHAAPLAERYAPWPQLERALARADVELLDYDSAARRLAVALEHEPYDLRLQLLRAEALLAAGRAEEAAAQARSVLALQPQRRDAKRLLAMAQVHAGEPGGRRAVEDLLLEDPDDAQLAPYLEEGPPPAYVPRPTGGVHDH